MWDVLCPYQRRFWGVRGAMAGAVVVCALASSDWRRPAEMAGWLASYFLFVLATAARYLAAATTYAYIYLERIT